MLVLNDVNANLNQTKLNAIFQFLSVLRQFSIFAFTFPENIISRSKLPVHFSAMKINITDRETNNPTRIPSFTKRHGKNIFHETRHY